MARGGKGKTIARRGLMLVLSSPSGAGKTTLSRMLLTEERIALSISVTTRARRPGEVHGRHYHFIDRKKFDQMVKAGELLEYAEVFGNFYGTPKKPVEKALKAGRDVLFDVDWQGTKQLAQTRAARSGQHLPVAAVEWRVGAATAHARARRQEGHTRPHGQGGRRDDALGRIRLRRSESRPRPRVRRGACDPRR